MKAHLAIGGTKPNLLRSGIEVERQLLFHFCLGIPRREYFHTNFGGMEETGAIAKCAPSTFGGPGDVRSLYSVGGGNGTFSEDTAIRNEGTKEMPNLELQVAMAGSWRRTHNDMPVTIGFNSAFDLREFRISNQLLPSAQVNICLRGLRRELDCHCGHGRKIAGGGRARQLW